MVLWACSAHGGQLQGSKRGICLTHFTVLPENEPNRKSIFLCNDQRGNLWFIVQTEQASRVR